MGSNSACLWPWTEGTLPAYWHVCKFDLHLILAIFSALTSVPARHLPVYRIRILQSNLAGYLDFLDLD